MATIETAAGGRRRTRSLGLRWRRCALVTLGGFVAGWAVVGAAALLMARAGEFRPLERMVERQQASDLIYNALSPSAARYKILSHQSRAPEIVALGTSRAMQLRQSAFRVPFYNLGGLSRGVPEMFGVLDRLDQAGHRPAVVLAFLDFWTFGTARVRGVGEAMRPRGARYSMMGEANPLRLPVDMLLSGQLSFAQAWAVVTGAAQRNWPTIGLTPLIGGNGFTADGSFHYLSFFIDGQHRRPLADRWMEAERRISERSGQFVGDLALDRAALAEFDMLVHEWHDRGTTVVPVLPPLPQTILQRLAAEGEAFAYIDALRAEIRERFGDAADGMSALEYGGSDCEFVDGIHGGEVVYLRLVERLASAYPALASRLDRDAVARLIATYAGQITAAEGPLAEAWRAVASKTVPVMSASSCP